MPAPQNQIVPFALSGGANVEDPVTWANDPTRQTGFVNGVADPSQVNTAIRQAAYVAAMVAQFTCDNANINVNDDGNISAFEQSFEAALLASVLTSPLLHPQVQQVYYVAPGSYNFTVPPYVTQIEIWVWGGGAGGGGTSGNGSPSGGSGGGFAVGIFTVVPGQTYVVTVGAGGAGGAAGANAGQNGGVTSIALSGGGSNLIYATGGTAGRGATAGIYALGGPTYTPGGLGVGGSFQYQGEHGHSGFALTGAAGSAVLTGGPGGGSWGVQNTFFADGNQQSGYGPGGGGSGGANPSAPTAGGAGLPGMCWIRYTI